MNLLINERVNSRFTRDLTVFYRFTSFPLSANVLYNWEHVYSYLLIITTLLTSLFNGIASLIWVLWFLKNLQALIFMSLSLTKSQPRKLLHYSLRLAWTSLLPQEQHDVSTFLEMQLGVVCSGGGGLWAKSNKLSSLYTLRSVMSYSSFAAAFVQYI